MLLLESHELLFLLFVLFHQCGHHLFELIRVMTMYDERRDGSDQSFQHSNSPHLRFA